MAKIIIFPVGPITPYVWGIAKNFIDPTTTSKVGILVVFAMPFNWTIYYYLG